MKPRRFFSDCLPSSIILVREALDLKIAACIGVCALSSLEHTVAAITWDNGSADQLWSNTVNWNPDGAAAANDIVFDATGSSLTAGVVTNIVDASINILSLTFNNTGTATQTTQINNSQILTVSGATTSAFSVNNTASGASTVAITGAGTLAVTGGTSANFNVGTTVVGGSSTQTLDMSGLANFSADVGTFGLGTGGRNAGAVTLGASSSVTATTITIGSQTATAAGAPVSNLNLGQANTILANTINVAGGRNNGTFQFRTTGLTNPTVSIANRANSAGANLNVALLDTNASGGITGSVDFSGGTLTGTFGTINLGRGANGTAGGSGTANMTFGAGSMSATTMILGLANNGSNTSSTGIGNFTMTAGAGTVTATTVTVGSNTQNNNTNRLNRATGTFTQNGGTAAITTLNLGDRQNTSADGNVTGTYNLAGGTLKAQTIQAGNNGTGAGTVTRAFNWTGGTIQNLNSTTDLTIASTNSLSLNVSGAGNQKFTADSSRTITVNAPMTGTGGFTKDGAGTLTLGGTNSYGGTTTISGGTLKLGGTGSITSPGVIVGANTTFDVSGVTGGYTLGSTQTLSGTGSVTGAATIAGTLSPGNSPGTLNTGNQIWINGGDYNWQVANTAGAAGTGYDTIALTGTLDLSSAGLTLGGFSINLWSLSSTGPDVNGDATNFNNLLPQSWTLVSTTGGITGFDATDFTINVGAINGTSGFSNALDPQGSFQIAQNGSDLVLTYSVVPEPASILLGSLGLLAILRRRRN